MAVCQYSIASPYSVTETVQALKVLCLGYISACGLWFRYAD